MTPKEAARARRKARRTKADPVEAEFARFAESAAENLGAASAEIERLNERVAELKGATGEADEEILRLRQQLSAEIGDFADLPEAMFNAYNLSAGGKTWDGKDIPPFSEVGVKVRGHWKAAAVCALRFAAESEE